MYSEKQYYNALALYDKCGSATKVITQLGYPVRRQTLYNWIARNFHADCPNEKWLTDITEFSISAGKIYFSPMIDCFDGIPLLLTVCICDDQPEDVAAIQALAERFAQTHKEQQTRLAVFQSPFALLDHLEKNAPFDLYLLDMLMPHMMGIELAQRIRAQSEPAALLFLTTSREYAVEAFGVHAAG